jgi:hypothetical protein
MRPPSIARCASAVQAACAFATLAGRGSGGCSFVGEVQAASAAAATAVTVEWRMLAMIAGNMHLSIGDAR